MKDINDIVSDIYNQILQAKNDLVKKRIEEILGEEFDPIAEQAKKFPRIIRVIQDDIESYYWNDGSDEGLRLITFVPKRKEINTFDSSFKLQTGFDYY